MNDSKKIIDENDMDFTKICRSCLKDDKPLQCLKEIKIDGIFMVEMISYFVKYKLSDDDEYPRQMCKKCIEDVENAYEFKIRCEKSHETLKSFLNASKTASKNQSDGDHDYRKSKEEPPVSDKYVQTDDTTFHPCEKCDHRFFSLASLKKHREDEHQGTAHACRICQKIYSRVSHLKRHIAGAHPEMGLTYSARFIDCTFCNRTMRKDKLKVHLNCCSERKNHVKEENDKQNAAANAEKSVSEVRAVQKIQCDFCKESFMSKQTYESHVCDGLEQKASVSADKNQSKEATKIEIDNVFTEPILEVICKTEPQLTSYHVPLATMDDSEHSFQEDESSDKDEIKPEISSSEAFSGFESEVTPSKITIATNKDVSVSKRDSSGRFCCDACGKTYTRSTHLRRHALTHLNEKPFGCEKCPKRFTRHDHLKHHMSVHSGDALHRCDLCNRNFSRAEHLRRHKNTKHNPDITEKLPAKKTEICPLCKKGFTTARYLQQHLRYHTDRRYDCKFCAQTFESRETLQEHHKTHIHEKPYLCSECGLRFVRNDYLIIHMRRHNGEKPYKCKFCAKGFPRATDLNVHERYHTGEKTHLCTTCGKGFHRAYNLLVHMRVHTGERPYECPHCTKKFAQGNDLKAHIRRHTGERFKCELCNMGFIQAYHLNQHKRQVHGINAQSHIGRLEKFVPVISEGEPKVNDRTAAAASTASGADPQSTDENFEMEIMDFDGQIGQQKDLPPPVGIVKIENGLATQFSYRILN